MSNLIINKKQLRRLLLDLAKKNRSHTFTQVADSNYTEAHSLVVTWAMKKVEQLPSRGKTIQ